MRFLLLIAATAACGRIGFAETGDPGAAPVGGDATLPAAFVDEASCATGALELTLRDGATVGDTLLVAFFMREPNPNVPPTIGGGGLTWGTDLAAASTQSTNRRTLALFRASVTSALTPGTKLVVDHPAAGANGGVLFRLRGDASTVGSTATSEGLGSAFTGTLTTTAQRLVCAIVHHNEGSVVFQAPFQSRYDFNVNCGSTRQSVGLHISTADSIGPTNDCAGVINANLSWLVAIPGYNNLEL